MKRRITGADLPGRPAAGRRGFTLIEALVALVVAGLVLPSLARALGGAWAAATRTPMEVVSGMIIARDVAFGASVPAEARARGFAAERTSAAVTVLLLPSDVAPPPPGTGKDDAADLKPEATPAAFKLAAPLGLGGRSPGTPAAASLALRRVSVAVRTPSGRRLVLDGLRLDDATR